MSEPIPGRKYLCIDDNEGRAKIVKGEYYEFVRVSNVNSKQGYFKVRGIPQPVSYNLNKFDLSNDGITSNNNSAEKFEVGKSYASKYYTPTRISNGAYYKILNLRGPIIFFENDSLVQDSLPSSYFDVNDCLEDKEQIMSKEKRNPMVNTNFDVGLIPIESAKEYETPGLFKNTEDSDDNEDYMYTILAVSYNPKDNHLIGFVVSVGREIEDVRVKDWRADWDASNFKRTTGSLTLTFK